MVQQIDLMGLGLNNQLANALSKTPYTLVPQGSTQVSALQIQGYQYFVICNSGTGGLNLPQVAPASGGSYLGDTYFINNLTSSAITIYVANNAQGSTVTIYGSAASTSGTTGVSLPAGAQGIFEVYSISTWVVNALMNAALQVTVPQQLEVVTPVIATAYGTSVGSANPIAFNQYFTYANTGTSSFALPAVNVATGPYLGDKFVVANMTAASIKIYSPLSAAGSVVMLMGGAVSATGTAGVTVPVGDVATFQVATISTWVVGIASV